MIQENANPAPPSTPVPPEVLRSRHQLERELLRLHGASFGWALSCCAWDAAEAEEVLQGAYLKALDGRARFDGRSSCRTWFFGVVRVTAAERRRSRWLRGKTLGKLFRLRADDAVGESPEGASSRAESLEQVRECLRQLSQRQRSVLHLVFYQDLTLEEAGRVLGLRIGTVRKYYERAKARLRSLLAEEPA